jgi:hypothetical protein
LLAGLSLISDHELGLPPDDAVRSCVVATALARKLDLHDGEVADVFHDSLLQHVGCTGYAHETYLVWGDDLAANRAAQRTNFAQPKELFTAYMPTLLQDVGGWKRARVAGLFLAKGPGSQKRFAAASCEVAEQTARRLGLSEGVQPGLRQCSRIARDRPHRVRAMPWSLSAHGVRVYRRLRDDWRASRDRVARQT